MQRVQVVTERSNVEMLIAKSLPQKNVFYHKMKDRGVLIGEE